MSFCDAIESNDLNLMKQLISTGTDLNFFEYKGTPRTYAVFYNRLEFVRALLEAKADVSKATSDSYTPLHMAAWKGYTECIKVTTTKH